MFNVENVKIQKHTEKTNKQINLYFPHTEKIASNIWTYSSGYFYASTHVEDKIGRDKNMCSALYSASDEHLLTK